MDGGSIVTSMGIMARAYARRGWAVLPVHSSGPLGCSCRRADCSSVAKHPRLAHGLLQASVDPATVTGWWRRWPDANIGITTGAASGIVVLDVDGQAGKASLEALRRRWVSLGEPRWVRTGSGGWHAWYRHPGGRLANTAGRLGPGLDTRGDGGYVVAPPSVHATGRAYQWVGTNPPGALPGWLLGLLRPPPRPRVVPRVAPVGRCSAYSAAALRGEVARVAGSVAGTRNHTLNQAAFALGTLVGAGALEEVVVVDALVSSALSSGLGEAEARHTIASGLRAGKATPRVLETTTRGAP